jgi:hypothetical protein
MIRRSRQGLGLWRVLNGRAGEAPPPSQGGLAGGLPVREFTPEGLAIRLLGAAGGAVTGVDIDELGPDVLAAQIAVTGPAGTRQVTGTPAAPWPSPPGWACLSGSPTR